jgi:hypothetical protein
VSPRDDDQNKGTLMANEPESVVGRSPPPRKSDVLFGPGADWQANACVNYGTSEIAYQSGYRRAALHLAEHVCDTGRGQDFLIYPIVYLYRHHIELALKSIISVSCFLLDRDMTDKDLETLGRHDLDKLWNLARPLLNATCELVGQSALPADDLDGIDSYISQLHTHDPDGQRFRYATTKARAKRLPSLDAGLKLINSRDFAIAMERLADYLNGLETWFDHLADQKAEMRAAYEQDGWC